MIVIIATHCLAAAIGLVMNNYWVGVITGSCVAAGLFAVLMFSVVGQNAELKERVAELDAKVGKHEEIMRAYEFYNWHYSLQMKEEDKE